MWKDIKWLRLTPDRAGRGGTKTGIHSFQQTPVNDIRSLSGAHVYRGSWRRDYDNTDYPGEQKDPTGIFSLGIHGYAFPSLTNPSALPTTKILQQNVHPGACVIWDATSGTTRQTRPGTNQMGTFLNIGGRCFFGDGGTEALVMDDRTPAIHSQPNQPLGVSAPAQALPLTAGVSYSNAGTAYSYNNSFFLNSPNPDNLISTIPTTDTVLVTFVNPVGYFFGAPASGAVTVAGKTSNTAPFSAPNTITVNTGSQKVTLNGGGTWPANGEYCGLAINFNGFSFVIAETATIAQEFNIDGTPQVLATNEALLLGIYDGPTFTGTYTITGSQVKLTNAATCVSINSGTQGYGQSTASNLVQCLVLATRSNGYYRNLGNIDLGPVSGGVPDTVTNCSIPTGTTELYSASAPWVDTDVEKTIVVDHAGDPAGTTMLVTSISAIGSPTLVHLRSPNQNTVGAALTNVRSWWVSNSIGVNDATITAGTAILESISNPWTPNDVGKEVIIGGAGAVTAQPTADALFGTITTFTTPGKVTISLNAVTTVSGKQAYWGGSISNTHTGPTYAYAWYDPETGHCSNISPLFTIPRPTVQGSYADFANLTPMFDIDPGMIAYPPGFAYPTSTSDAIRFSHILFFRTLSTPGSSTLYPIGSLQPFVGKVHPGFTSTRGSWNPGMLQGWAGIPNSWVTPGALAGQRWYDFSSDSDLILAGGFRAPQFTNNKPMALLRGGITQPANPYLIAHWDRRLWCVATQEPDKLMFSCDDAQCPLGVPEESFPPTNFLRLPSAADGKFLGLRTFGDKLVATTQRFAYIVAGNNESNYRLMKISSSMPGVGQYQMDEFPTYTGAEGEPTTVFFIGTDRIVYQWTIGGTVVPISQPIQDQLDTSLQLPGGTYTNSIVHCVSAWGRRLVVVQPNLLSSGTTGIPTFIYDINDGVWSTSTRNGGSNPNSQSGGVSPMTTVYSAAGVPVNEIYAIATSFGASTGIHTISWLRDDVASASLTMVLTTFPITFDGKKTRKQLVAVNLHATPGTWIGALYVNDQFGPALTFSTYPDPIDSIYAPTGVQVAVNDVIAADLVTLAGQMNTNGMPVIGYRFAVTISKSSVEDTNPANIYAIDFGYIDMPSPGDGDA